MTEPVTAERDPLVATLNWQGWFGTGAYGFAPTTGDSPLLRKGRWQMAFLRPAPAGGRKRLLAFDWATSNAPRRPASVRLARRFLEAGRDAQRVPYAANFDCGSPVAIAGVPAEGNCTQEFRPTVGGVAEKRTLGHVERAGLRAPGRSGFFTLRRDDEVLVRGAMQFADARQGDFRTAETFSVELPGEQKSAIERNTRADPYAPLWLLALAGLVLGSWWTRKGGTDVK